MTEQSEAASKAAKAACAEAEQSEAAARAACDLQASLHRAVQCFRFSGECVRAS